MSISIIDIAKKSAKFTGINFFAKLLSIPKQIVIAIVLSPSELGMIGYIMLWIMYAGWIKTGAASTLSRELPGLLKTNQHERALSSQYVAWSADFLISFFVFIGLIVAAFFQSSILLRNLLLIGAFVYLSGKVAAYLHSMNWIRLRFSKLANIQLSITVISTVITLLLIYWVKIYTLLLVQLISSILNITLLLRIKGVSFKFKWDVTELLRLMRIGIVIALASIMYGAFVGIVDQTIIAKYLPFDQLGLFIFAYSLMSLVAQGFRDFTSVLAPIFYGHSDTVSSNFDAFKDINKMVIYFTLLSCIAMPFSQVGFIFLVEIITVKYSDAKLVYMVLSTQIFLEVLSFFPNLILQSKRVNKQNLLLISMSLGLLFNIVLDVIVVKLGYGIVGIAIVTTATQGFVTILGYFFSRYYITKFISLMMKIIPPFMLALLLTYLNWIIFQGFGIWSFIGLSILINFIAWSVLVLTFYSDYFSKEKLMSLKKVILHKKVAY